jgi:hypothetical protein
MINKKTLTLEAYAVLGVAVLAHKGADAQVYIRDYDPDLRMMNWREDGIIEDIISIDIDENGIDDLIFAYDHYGMAWDANAELEVTFNDAVTGIIVKDSCWNCYDFSTGDSISGAIVYTNNPFQLYFASRYSSGYGYISTYYGAFHTSDFLGLLINIDGSDHYGWVRLSIKTLADEDVSGFRQTGSPLTIYEVAYNFTPMEDILCDAFNLPELKTIDYPVLNDVIDANNITDLEFSIYVFDKDSLDFSEIRFFLVPSKEDIIDFSVEQAMLLSTEKYLSIPAETLSNGTNRFNLPLTLLDINGDSFSPEKYYSAFYLKLPASGFPSYSLSAPFNVIKPELQRCELNSNDIYATESDVENYIELSFTADEFDYDISEYGIGLILEQDYEDWVYYGANPDSFDLNWVIHIPKTGLTSYDTLVSAPSKDIYGEEIIPYAIYYPILIGFGDGYYRDLFCYEVGEGNISLSAMDIYRDAFHIWQNTADRLHVILPESNTSKCTLELTNTMGEFIAVEIITSVTQTFSFPSLPDGIYIATIKQNDVPVAVSKIILQK